MLASENRLVRYGDERSSRDESNKVISCTMETKRNQRYLFFKSVNVQLIVFIHISVSTVEFAYFHTI